MAAMQVGDNVISFEDARRRRDEIRTPRSMLQDLLEEGTAHHAELASRVFDRLYRRVRRLPHYPGKTEDLVAITELHIAHVRKAKAFRQASGWARKAIGITDEGTPGPAAARRVA